MFSSDPETEGSLLWDTHAENCCSRQHTVNTSAQKL